MADVSNGLATTDTSGVTLTTTSTSGTSSTSNDAQYPYSTQDGQTTNTDVASPPTPLYSHVPPLLRKALATLVGPVYVDEANETLAISTGIERAEFQSNTQEMHSGKQRLDSQNARLKQEHLKYLHDFKRAKAHAKSMAGLKLFIRIAAPIAAVVVAGTTAGAGSVLVPLLVTYAVVSTTTSSAGGPNIGLESLTEQGIKAGLKATGLFSNEEASKGAMLGAGAIGALAMVYSPEVVMTNPEFVGRLGQATSGYFTSEQNAAIIGAVVGPVAGIVAGGPVGNSGAAAKSASGGAEGAGGAGGGGAGGVAGAAEEAGAASAKAAEEAAEELARHRELIAIATEYGNVGGGYITQANGAAGAAQGGLEYDHARVQYDMTVDLTNANITNTQIDGTLTSSQSAARRSAAILKRFSDSTDVALRIQQEKQKTNLQLVSGQVETV